MNVIKTDILIIGAGLAGLAAGYKLKQLGREFKIVEARDRIGGRVETVKVQAPDGELTVELGAEWIGKDQTTIKELCEQFGLNLAYHRPLRNVRVGGKYFSTEDEFYRESWKRHIAALVGRINHDTSEEDLRKLDEISFYDFLVANNATEREIKIFELFQGTMIGCGLNEMSAYTVLYKHLSLDKEKSDGDDYRIVGGNSLLPISIADNIGQENILLNAVVHKIEQDGHGVLVTLRSGEVISAAQVICTIPPKVLLDIQWTPEPSSKLRTAWEEIGFANITKTAFVFDKRFWKDEHAGVYSDSLACQVYHATDKQDSEWGVLGSYAFGEYDRPFRTLNKTESLNAVLNTFDLDHHNARHYVSTLQKIWQDDEYSKGAYSFYKPAQWFGLRPIMLQPFKRVHFAGEYIAEDQGFMNGAIESGLAAAVAMQ